MRRSGAEVGRASDRDSISGKCRLGDSSLCAGLPAHVFMPKDAPKVTKTECRIYGAHLTLVKGLIDDAGRALRREQQDDWFDISTLKEPYRAQGKKTMGIELAEQLGWRLPDAIIYPTGGTGIVGIRHVEGICGTRTGLNVCQGVHRASHLAALRKRQSTG